MAMTLDARDKLPDDLPCPLVYLSEAQEDTIDHSCPSLEGIDLPAWVPQEVVAKDLGFDGKGMRTALEHTDGLPYVWATEFENVHEFWSFTEPRIEVADNEQVWDSVEHWYQSCKPKPFSFPVWKEMRDDVMRQGLQGKLHACPAVRELLLKTGNHPLVSIKADKYWGVHPVHGGRNRLGELWMELRAELQEKEKEAERKRKRDDDPFADVDDASLVPPAAMCCICTVTPANMVLLPCGHLCTCHNCVARAIDPNDDGEDLCPICRKDVDDRVRVYPA